LFYIFFGFVLLVVPALVQRFYYNWNETDSVHRSLLMLQTSHFSVILLFRLNLIWICIYIQDTAMENIFMDLDFPLT
jgi:hypothetical protein